MSTIINAAPKVILNGIQDLSTRVVPREPEQLPIHLPQFFSFTERGPAKNQVINNVGEINQIYGSKTADYKSKFASHVTPFINTILAEGNAVMLKRLLPADATVGNILLKLHLTPTTTPVYERELDGRYTQDEFGDYVPIEGKTVDGFTLKWELAKTDPATDIGVAVVETSGESKIYPVMEYRAGSQGEYSGNVGFRLSVPTTSSSSQPDFDLISQYKSMILRFAIVERADELSSPNVLDTMAGEKSVDFTFKENVVDRYDIEKYYDKALIPSYQDLTTPGFVPVYSPIGEIHLYKAYHEEISRTILDAEIASVATTGDINVRPEEMDIYEVNYFTGVTPYDVPYSVIQYSLEGVEGKTFTLISEQNTQYLSKGSDGIITNEQMDSSVSDLMKNGWDDPNDPLSDMAVNPYSAIWDSGFGLDTKKSLCEALGRRKDVSVMLSTFEFGTDSLNWAEEESVGNILKTYASGYPESVVYGTPVCRALVVSGRGFTVDGVWDQPVPLAVDLSQKVAKFMGAGNGIMKEGMGFDVSPNNQITLLRDVTGAYKTERQRQKDWDAGMVWAQNYNRRSLFYPAVQTVYPNDTSVLNSAINMYIAAELEKVCDFVWRNLSGNAKLTADQFIERSNELITERTTNRFDNRVIIVPETFYTAADTARGFSWSCRVNMYANNMKTVGTFTIVARRQTDLAA